MANPVVKHRPPRVEPLSTVNWQPDGAGLERSSGAGLGDLGPQHPGERGTKSKRPNSKRRSAS